LIIKRLIVFSVNCKFCGKEFLTTSKLYKYCPEHDSNSAYYEQRIIERKKENDKKYKDQPDIPICKICGFKSTVLVQHITCAHKMTTKEYMEKFNVGKDTIYHQSYRDNVVNHGKGKEMVCGECGTEFVREHSRQKYCCAECSESANQRTKKTKNPKEKTPRGRRVKCRQCKKKFVTNKTAHVYFCKPACRDKWRYELKRNKTTHQHTCKFCKNEFESTYAVKPFCSNACKRKYNRELYRKRSIKDSIKRHGNNPEMPECKICGFKGPSLKLHIKTHDISVATYCRRYKVNEKDLSYKPTNEKSSRNLKKLFQKAYEKYRDSQHAESQT